MNKIEKAQEALAKLQLSSVQQVQIVALSQIAPAQLKEYALRSGTKSQSLYIRDTIQHKNSHFGRACPENIHETVQSPANYQIIDTRNIKQQVHKCDLTKHINIRQPNYNEAIHIF